ncbi:unnamed protein product, partial [Durusdinium trenchii]
GGPSLRTLPREEDEGLGLVALPRKLQLQHITLLSHPVRISAIDNFFTEEECHGWITWGEKHGFDEAKQKQNSTYAHRNNGRIELLAVKWNSRATLLSLSSVKTSWQNKAGG